jgi:hypothetical protein
MRAINHNRSGVETRKCAPRAPNEKRKVRNREPPMKNPPGKIPAGAMKFFDYLSGPARMAARRF